jgi:DNA-binding beta-propeller fold protein YncE
VIFGFFLLILKNLGEKISFLSVRQGNVYVADTGNSRIQEFTNDGKFINKWPINTPTGAIDNIDIDVNSKGIIYLADRAADKVLVISP